AERPAVLLTEHGEHFTPAVKRKNDGRVVFSFPDDRKRAPTRGRHRLSFSYLTTLAALDTQGNRRVALVWSMPASEVDLKTATIEVSGPPGMRYAEAAEGLDETDSAVVRERFSRGEHSVLRLSRAQLPRTVAFAVALELDSSGPTLAPARERIAHNGHGAWL